MDLAMPSVDLDLHERSQCMADAAAGHTNASLVMSTVRGDGINLQPDCPATMTDGVVCLQMLTSHTHIHSRCDARALMQTLLGRAPPDVLSASTAFGCLVWFLRVSHSDIRHGLDHQPRVVVLRCNLLPSCYWLGLNPNPRYSFNLAADFNSTLLQRV